jgi:hypothetical protein
MHPGGPWQPSGTENFEIQILFIAKMVIYRRKIAIRSRRNFPRYPLRANRISASSKILSRVRPFFSVSGFGLRRGMRIHPELIKTYLKGFEIGFN